MKAVTIPIPSLRDPSRPRLKHASRLTALALAMPFLGLIAPSAPALANPAPTGPEYSLSIVEGESTLPERQIVEVSASVHPRAEVVLSIIRNGIVVAKSSGMEGAWMSQVPQVGDVVSMESPLGAIVGSTVYDGLPSIDPTVCAGSASFSGQHTASQEVEGGYYSLVAHRSYIAKRVGGRAQITALTSSAYAGYFLAPVAIGQTVWASESSRTPLAGGAVFAYSSENDRPVAACPVPILAPFVAPAPPALAGSIFKLPRIKIRKLLKSGWRSQVSINQPGTVTQDLYLKGGTLPAYASSTKHKRHARKPAAVLLAHGSSSAASAGKVSVLIKVTAQGARRLRHATSVQAVLLTTLRSRSGAKLTLGRRSVSLHR
jgi:hypothetical protein